MDQHLVVSLNNVASQMNRYLSLVIFVFGIFGNVINILVLLQRTLRSNPCALLFLISSIANLIVIFGGLTTRMLMGWAADLTSTIGWLCKFRVYIVWVSRTFAVWLITLTTVDRWLLASTNMYRRQMSTLKNAYRGMIIILFCSAMIYLILFYCYEANLINAPSKCNGKTDTCRLLTDLIYISITTVIPLFLMSVFGLMTISNVRRAQRCIQPKIDPRVHRVNNQVAQTIIVRNQQQRWKKIDRHLFSMLLMQVVILTLFTLPVAVQKIYQTCTQYKHKSLLQVSIENLTYNFVALSLYFSSGASFYLFTICSGTIYRNALRHLVEHVMRKLRLR